MIPILGQECICPDGLGRISEIQQNRYGTLTGIRVETYVKNRGCIWNPDNVKVFPIGPTKDIN